MNWQLTPAQQQAARFLELSIEEVVGETTTRKHGYHTNLTRTELLEFIAEKWRELKRPPKTNELKRHKHAIRKHFNSIRAARQCTARMLLSDAEREEYVWRCPYCGRTGFKNTNGWVKHMECCRRKHDTMDDQ